MGDAAVAIELAEPLVVQPADFKPISNERRLLFATLFCALFMIAEAVGGVLSGSLAILTDALHLFADVGGEPSAAHVPLLCSTLPLHPRVTPALPRR